MGNHPKPHLGRITSWYKTEFGAGGRGLGYLICGTFLDHPKFMGMSDVHTSYVISHDTETGEIETKNSRYTLVGAEWK